MAHDDSAEKKPGERPEGTFHYNPGNMAGKTIGDEAMSRSTLTQNRTVSSATSDLGNATRPSEAAHASANSMGRIVLSKATDTSS
jgi:hypothetical protein